MKRTSRTTTLTSRKMPVNKFGLFERRNDAIDNWSALVRSYVRDNALCRIGVEFDAKSCKIRRVAQPEDDNDAANKLYVEQCVKILRDQQQEFVERLAAFERDVHTLRAVINELRRGTTTESKPTTNKE